MRMLAALLLFAALPAAAQDTAYCAVPGELISEDAAGDAVLPVAAQGENPVEAHDVLTVHFAEPAADRLYVTLKVTSLEPEPAPQTVYYVFFTLDDGVNHFVTFRPYVLPGQAQFEYGAEEPGPAGQTTFLAVHGAADPESSFAADGTITWALTRSAIPALAAATEAYSVIGEARVIVGSPFRSPVQPPPPLPRVPSGFVYPVDSSPGGYYAFHGYEACAGGAKWGSGLVAGAMPAAFLLLGLLGFARRRG